MADHQGETRAVRETLAQKIQWLFATVRPVVREPGGKRRPYSQTREHSQSVLAKALGVSPTYVSQLRSGKAGSPSIQRLKDIGEFFGVPAAYFLSEPELAAHIEAQIEHGVHQRRYEDGELSEPPASLSPAPSAHPAVPNDAALESLADRLEWLFRNRLEPTRRREYRDDEVAAAIGESPFFVRGLRSGELPEDHLTVAGLRKLADFFQVPPSFLIANNASHDAVESDLIKTALIMRRAGVDGLVEYALRAATADPDTSSEGVENAQRRFLVSLLQAALEQAGRAGSSPGGPESAAGGDR